MTPISSVIIWLHLNEVINSQGIFIMSEVKYVLYRRLSKEDRTRTQHGFESQSLDIQYFIDNNGGTIVGSFKEFISGGADTKPELEKALELCRELGADLLVSKLDRISRRVSQISKYMESALSIRVATMPSANNFTLHIFAALAEEERTAIRSRITRGLEAAKKKGVALGGSSPKWKASYQANKSNHIKPAFIQKSRDDAQPIVKEITNIIKYSRGNVTQTDIATHLNSSGLTTARGGEFTKGSVSRLIKKFNIDYSNKTKYDVLGG